MTDTYVMRYRDTDTVLLRRGKPVTLTDPTPQHLDDTVAVLSTLLGREVYAFKPTVHRLPQVQGTG